MQTLLKRWTDALLELFGLHSVTQNGWDLWVAFGLVLAAVVLIDFLCRLFLARWLRMIVEHTRVQWDDELFSKPALNASCHVVSAVLLYFVLPLLFVDRPSLNTFFDRMTQSYLVVTVCRLLCALIRAAFRIAIRRPAWQNKPIKGLRQTAQGIVWIIGAILIVSMLLGKSPRVFLTGLGASAAILMLIFKDSILGFVSGIQLSVNDMLQVGDWIELPKYGADGSVIEVTLTTVKIRNFDNSITTVPPYLLVSESFQNWQAMKRSGGRRVMRSVQIDVTTVRFCTPGMLAHFRQIELVRDFVEAAEQRAAAAASSSASAAGEPSETALLDGRLTTNLEIFRNYLVRYLQTRVPVRHDMKLMVRQLQPSDTGVPLQLYFFADTVDWQTFETIQSELFSHVIAIVGQFGLRLFQRPAGSDIDQLQPEPPAGREG